MAALLSCSSLLIQTSHTQHGKWLLSSKALNQTQRTQMMKLLSGFRLRQQKFVKSIQYL